MLKIKIVAISDTHTMEDEVIVPKCDVLIHSGDSDINKEKDLIKFNHWIGQQDADVKIVVPGNHDFLYQNHIDVCRNLLTNAILLIDQKFEYKGINFWGSPWQPWFHDWAFNLQRGAEIKAKWNLIPENTDVLITHGPPMGILDYVPHKGSVGCQDLLDTIERIKPRYNIFGHIHEGYGEDVRYWYENMKDTGKKTIFINASQCNRDYEIVNKPQVFHIFNSDLSDLSNGTNYGEDHN